jgi:hypothetical protein
MYLASKIHKELKKHFSACDLLGQEIPYGVISRRLNKILVPLGAKIIIKRDTELRMKPGSTHQIFSFSGYFNTGAKKKNAIKIFVHFPSNRKTFKFTKASYAGFIFMFSQVVQHEFIHESQYQFRPEQSDRLVKVHHSDKLSKKRLKQIEYLSTWCEIEAYAHDIAMEIKQYYPNSKPDTIIRYIDSHKKLYSYKLYKDAFKGTDWGRLKKSLLRKIWKWIPSAQIPVLV